MITYLPIITNLYTGINIKLKLNCPYGTIHFMGKRTSDIQSALLAIEALLNNDDIPSITKSSIVYLIKLVRDSVLELDSPPDKSIVHETRTRVDAPVVLKEFRLCPVKSEIEVNGNKHTLPGLEFNIIYNLAINNKRVVQFEPSNSLNTHLSILRRSYPILKVLIEHVRSDGLRGCYRLNATNI